LTENQLNAFLEAIQTNPTLKEKIEAASDLDGVVTIAKAAGFMISVDALQNNQIISDAMLQSVSAGVARFR